MRLPPIAPEALDTEQRRLYDDMKAGVASKYDAFVTVREDGALLGPWSAWLYQPELGRELRRRSPASNSCTGSEKVNSNSASFASKTKPLQRFGMQCSPRDQCRLPGL
jgi:hypothetical protein